MFSFEKCHTCKNGTMPYTCNWIPRRYRHQSCFLSPSLVCLHVRSWPNRWNVSCRHHATQPRNTWAGNLLHDHSARVTCGTAHVGVTLLSRRGVPVQSLQVLTDIRQGPRSKLGTRTAFSHHISSLEASASVFLSFLDDANNFEKYRPAVL